MTPVLIGFAVTVITLVMVVIAKRVGQRRDERTRAAMRAGRGLP